MTKHCGLPKVGRLFPTGARFEAVCIISCSRSALEGGFGTFIGKHD
jgi:hypothetical protein